ncbi:hypothetical protein [Nocardiopsis sp. M1B1]
MSAHFLWLAQRNTGPEEGIEIGRYRPRKNVLLLFWNGVRFLCGGVNRQ